MRTPSLFLRTLLFSVAMLMGTAHATVEIFRLEATLIPNPPVGYSSFFIDFADTGDGLLQFDEITAFSGVSTLNQFRDQITRIADIPGISTRSGTCFTDILDWCFASTGGGASATSDELWSYRLVAEAQRVPEPGALALVGVALALLLVGRRRNI